MSKNMTTHRFYSPNPVAEADRMVRLVRCVIEGWGMPFDLYDFLEWVGTAHPLGNITIGEVALRYAADRGLIGHHE
jgi:hypothetical protein